MCKRIMQLAIGAFLFVSLLPVVLVSWLLVVSWWAEMPMPLWQVLGGARQWDEQPPDDGPEVLTLDVVVPTDSQFQYSLHPRHLSVRLESCPVRLVVRRAEPLNLAAARGAPQ